MNKKIFNLTGARLILSASYGRKPSLHWKLLFGFGVILLFCAIGGGAFVFWINTQENSFEEVTVKPEQAFNKKQFEDVFRYFESRKNQFETVGTIEIPKDPS